MKNNLELIGVKKLYGSFEAVKGISIKITEGSYCCLLGPSGCGKTSLLRMIAGHEAISEGDIFIGLNRFGASGPGNKLYDHFGITADRIVDEVKNNLN